MPYSLEYHRKLRSTRKEKGLCGRCGKDKERSEVTQCNSCSTVAEDRRQKKYAIRRENKLCLTCGLPIDSKYKLCQVCRQIRLDSYHSTKVLSYYGSKCVECGESRLGCLELDHVNNDGAQHRRDINNDARYTTGTKLYQWLVDNDFKCNYELQILCANCHALKHWKETA